VTANIAFAIESYLELRSANVNHHNGDIDVDIRTGGDVPSESGNNGFGYAVLTDVGDESADNVLVAISDIGIENNDKSTTRNDKLHTFVLDLTGDTSRACSGSDYEVTKSSSDNEAFDTSYPIDVKGNKISIDDVNTNDLTSDTVKAIASFTADAITKNGKIKQICIDIQDVLKQSEISVGYRSNNNDDNDDNGNVEYTDKPIDSSNVSLESSFISITRENFLSTTKNVAIAFSTCFIERISTSLSALLFKSSMVWTVSSW
jgi:hypothetical protein